MSMLFNLRYSIIVHTSSHMGGSSTSVGRPGDCRSLAVKNDVLKIFLKFFGGILLSTICMKGVLRYRWQKLLSDSDARKQRLLRLQEQYRQVEDLYLTFAKKASTFNSWFENAEEDLTDPVRCNSIEEIKVGDAGIGHFRFLPVFSIFYRVQRQFL